MNSLLTEKVMNFAVEHAKERRVRLPEPKQ